MSPESINILIACEESQSETLAFLQRGFNVFSCDMQPCKSTARPDRHINGDVRPFLHGLTSFYTQDCVYHRVVKWHLVIAHPPCTFLCRMSSVLFRKNADYYIEFNGRIEHVNYYRYIQMLYAREFFFECLHADADFIAVENPIPMAIAQLPRPSFYTCPSWFGSKYSKKTLYWVKNLPPLFAALDFPNPKCLVHSTRGKYRSRTNKSLALAIAKQWGDFILDNLQ